MVSGDPSHLSVVLVAVVRRKVETREGNEERLAVLCGKRTRSSAELLFFKIAAFTVYHVVHRFFAYGQRKRQLWISHHSTWMFFYI